MVTTQNHLGIFFFMLPMLEMAGPKHAKFTKDINYVYNFENPLGDSKGRRLELTLSFAKLGRDKNSYNEIRFL